MPTATTSSRKRKTTEEAVESPPKRQTRARTAKATQEESTTKPKTTRITTASARIAAEARAAARSAPKTRAATATSTKRESKDKATTKDTTKPAKVQAKSAKSTSGSTSKPTTRVTKLKEETVAKDKAKTRLHKVKATDFEVKRTVRTRSATLDTEAVTKMDALSKKPVKRVTFQEDLIEEKENKPIPTKKETTTGIKAKPVRKTITPVAPRSKKSVTTTQPKSAPLSPKKVTQVAKSVSSSEDELLRTPPSKISKDLDTARMDTIPELNQSPNKSDVLDRLALLASPAKRPPPSPFKDGLSQSPKKFLMPGQTPDSRKTVSLETNKESLKQPPMKFDFTPVRPTAGKSDIGTMARTALLGTPARRPASPLKLGSARLPDKIGAPQTLTNTTSIIRHVKDGSLFSVTPRRLFPSPSKATTRTPAKQPELVTDEVAEITVGSHDPTISDEHVPSPNGFQRYSETVRFGESHEAFEHDVFEESGHYRSLEENSEDELSMGPLISSPQKRAMFRQKLAYSPSSSMLDSPTKALTTPKVRTKNQFMTPLAIQLGNWLATSPTKPDTEDVPSTRAFTPAPLARKLSQESRRTTMTPAGRSTCFEEQLPQIDVLATPEESMEGQDLHSNEDLDMVDDIVSDSVEEVIAATPEQLLRQDSTMDATDENDMNVDEYHDMTRESGNAVEVNPPVLQEALTELKASEDTIVERVSATPIEDTAMDDGISESGDFDGLEEDNTEIITRSQNVLLADDADSMVENRLVQSVNLSTKIDTSVLVPASSDLQTEEYGDENCEPVLPAALQSSSTVNTITELLHTPAKAIMTRQRETRTVARVPLKPCSDETPLPIKVRKGRSKSLSDRACLLPIDAFTTVAEQVDTTEETPEPYQDAPSTPRSVSQPLKALNTTGDELISLAGTPFKSVRKGADARILRGAVIHVDVHTSEGADASSIFVELLTQMGARCIKQWNWNSRATLSGSEDLAANAKVGITHVVFKDGSKRTLQKVREAKGLVLCVGVGWVLDCERSNKWLDEASYAVDTSTIPRGGHNRRKSMEPTLLASLNGNLSSVKTPAKPSRKSLRLSKARKSETSDPTQLDVDETILLSFTPGTNHTREEAVTPSMDDKNAQLLQRTCPPKQSQGNLLAFSGEAEDQASQNIKFKLTKARRKTMQFVPQVASPLSQEFPGDD